jgi:hypothetical protein
VKLSSERSVRLYGFPFPRRGSVKGRVGKQSQRL